MTAEPRSWAGCPAWLPKGAELYLRHTEDGQSLREIARAEGCHPSTILRRVRAFENRRDDPLVDEALTRIGSALRAQPDADGQAAARSAPFRPSDSRTEAVTARTPLADARPAAIPAAATAPSAVPSAAPVLTDAATLLREARRILRRLGEGDAVLAVSAEMEKAVVLRGEMRMAVVDRQVAEAFAVKGWIAVARPGRVATYAITSAGRAALRRMLAEDGAGDGGLAEAPAGFAGWAPAGDDRVAAAGLAPAQRPRVNLAESPVQMLARRREKDGSVFLSADLAAAAERLREDFELAQIGPRVTQNWDRFLTSGDRAPMRDGAADAGSRARDRVAAALRELGPGLGDVALRCCCYLEGLETAERRMGWSARSGKIVLRIALIRLKRHYDETYGGRMPLIG